MSDARDRGVPGIVQAVISSELPTLVTAGNGLRPVDGVAPDAVPASAKYMDASLHYFVTMGIPLLAGREFSAVHDIRLLDDVVSDSFAPRRLPVMLMAAFGLLALVLASVGVYAMLAAMAAAREREFAVRMTLVSQPSAIAALVLRQGGMWMELGLLLGVGGVLLVSRAVQSMLYGVSPFDPLAVSAAVLLLALSGACALIAPVRRATRVSPGSVLR